MAFGELRLRLLELGRKILARDLDAELLPGILRLGGRQRAFGLIAVVDVLPRIDVDQRLALLDELIVGHVERNHVAGDPRRDDDGAAIGVGVVGAFEIAGGEPVIDTGYDQQPYNSDTDCDDQGPAFFSGFLAGFYLGVLPLRLALGGFSWPDRQPGPVLPARGRLRFALPGPRRIIAAGGIVVGIGIGHRQPAS